jgi:hypothetical protein
MGHFAYYEYIPHGRYPRSKLIQYARRSIRWLLWTRFLAQEVRFQKIYDAMQALRAEQRRLDGEACVRLAMRRRLDFMEQAIASLEAQHEIKRPSRASVISPPRSRVA